MQSDLWTQFEWVCLLRKISQNRITKRQECYYSFKNNDDDNGTSTLYILRTNKKEKEKEKAREQEMCMMLSEYSLIVVNVYESNDIFNE